LASIARNGSTGSTLGSSAIANVVNMSIGSTPCDNGCGGGAICSLFC
jgi:hypothetical protein